MAASGTNEVLRPGPSKKAKRDWHHNGISRSKRGNTYAHCDYCHADFSIAHGGGGANDVKRHLATSKHLDMLKATSNTPSLTMYTRPSPIVEGVTRAEVLFANFVAEHNLSFMIADHFTHLTSAMFPDSKTAKAFSVAKTKQHA